MEETPGQPGEDAYEALIEEAISGSDDSFAGENPEQPQAPDVGESLEQLDQRLAELSNRLDETDYDDENDWDPDALQYNAHAGGPRARTTARPSCGNSWLRGVRQPMSTPWRTHSAAADPAVGGRYPALREPETFLAGEASRCSNGYR